MHRLLLAIIPLTFDIMIFWSFYIMRSIGEVHGMMVSLIPSMPSNSATGSCFYHMDGSLAGKEPCRHAC